MSAEAAVAKLGAAGIAAFTDPAARLRTPSGTLWRGELRHECAGGRPCPARPGIANCSQGSRA